MKSNRNRSRDLGFYILLIVILVATIYVMTRTPDTEKMTYSELSDLFTEEKVKSFYTEDGELVMEIRTGQRDPATGEELTATKSYSLYSFSVFYEDFHELIAEQKASGVLESYDYKVGFVAPWWLAFLPYLVLVGGAMWLWYAMMRQQGGGAGGIARFSRARTRVGIDEKNKKTFADVAGCDEEKEELAEIVDFLKDPASFTAMGARIPKGVLLVGPPGTGKTLLAKAVAGEANVQFLSISGSDFVELYVGVGAGRVRDLFDQAKKVAPAIIFIDEIDAVGRQRGSGLGGGNDEREQTLNQLLVEMDGFADNAGVIVMAATNRADILDNALLRPGRFDRRVYMGFPDVKGREEVFKIYAKNKPLDENVDLKVLAKRTPGFTPADIENMMNEAALLTARRNGTIIHMDDLEEAITRVIAGPQKRSRVMSDKERRLTAYHEAGHAIVMRATPGADPVHQVTIMPRGTAGGFTMQLPEEDRYYITRTEMEHDIMHLLGGRIAEALVMGDISTGASNDLERATKTAHDMVTKYGMSEAIGPLNYSDADEVFLGRDFTSKQNYSEELASKIDAEVRRIIEKAYADAEQLLKDHRDELDRVANALLEMETLDAEQFEAIYTGTKTVAELQEEDSERNKARKVVEDAEAAARAEREAEEAARLQSEQPGLQGGIRVSATRPTPRRIARIDRDGKISVIDEKDATEEDQPQKGDEK